MNTDELLTRGELHDRLPWIVDRNGDSWILQRALNYNGDPVYEGPQPAGHLLQTLEELGSNPGIDTEATTDQTVNRIWAVNANGIDAYDSTFEDQIGVPHSQVISSLTSSTEADGEEVRVVNETTGGEKGQKLERFDLVPAEAMADVARHYGIGARKYADNNWRRGYNWSLSLAALERHLNQFKAGDDIDDETGSPHMAAVVFHALALLTFMDEHPELDDRYHRGDDR